MWLRIQIKIKNGSDAKNSNLECHSMWIWSLNFRSEKFFCLREFRDAKFLEIHRFGMRLEWGNNSKCLSSEILVYWASLSIHANFIPGHADKTPICILDPPPFEGFSTNCFALILLTLIHIYFSELFLDTFFQLWTKVKTGQHCWKLYCFVRIG